MEQKKIIIDNRIEREAVNKIDRFVEGVRGKEMNVTRDLVSVPAPTFAQKLKMLINQNFRK
jgi:hypothetical protein